MGQTEGRGPMIDRLAAALEGRYRVEGELGQGGMALVFLAEDVKHHRKVAIKVLRPELAAMVGAERFLAEIEVTANLQHPHILPLYDSGEADGLLFYVMPWVEGESLRERLERERQLPVDEALRITKAVASGLDYAHRQGVVHRDIKPANILLQDGQPLVADFGIALALQQAGGGRLTETGLSLGTPYYMSPEQATSEQDPGPRSDVYSLGCVLFEMLTGEPPFTGSTAQAVLGKILTREPPLATDLRRTVPSHVDAVLLRALEKVPADRFPSAAEFAKALDDPGAAGTQPRAGRTAVAPGGSGLRAWLPWSVAAVAVTALVWSWPARGGPSTEVGSGDVLRAVLELPENASLEMGGAPGIVAISDDGSVVLVGAYENGRQKLLRRRMNARDFRPVPGTEDASGPFLSPDGQWGVFAVAGRGMWKVPLEGGPAELLDGRGGWAQGDWGDDGTIYYSRSYLSGLWKLPAGGGEPEELTRPAEGELAHWNPQLLPDGEHLLFTAFQTPDPRISVFSLITGERKDVHRGGVFPRYVRTGHILYVAGGAIYAVPFDLDALEVTGDAFPVVEDVAMSATNGVGSYDVSDNGTLVYIPASDVNVPSALVWVDRRGREEPLDFEPDRFQDPAISPDGERIAVSISVDGSNRDVWVMDLSRGGRQRVTSRAPSDFNAVWTPAGERLIYSSERPVFDMYTAPADQSAPASPFVVGDLDKFPGNFTPDGDTLVYQVQGAEGFDEAWKVSVSGGDPLPVHQPAFDVRTPLVSPDGRWLTYSSPTSGTDQVYLSPWAEPGERRIQLSVNGGTTPRWSRGGREIVYRQGDRMMAVEVDPETGEPGRPQALFEAPYQSAVRISNYDVTPDGERFLMVKRLPEQRPGRVVVVTNFFEELRAVGGGTR